MRLPTYIGISKTFVVQNFFNSYPLGEKPILLWLTAYPVVLSERIAQSTSQVPHDSSCSFPSMCVSFVTFTTTVLCWVHVSETIEVSPLSQVMIDSGLYSWSPFSLNILLYTLTWPSLEYFCQSLQPFKHSPHRFDTSVSRDVYNGHLQT